MRTNKKTDGGTVYKQVLINEKLQVGERGERGERDWGGG